MVCIWSALLWCASQKPECSGRPLDLLQWLTEMWRISFSSVLNNGNWTIHRIWVATNLHTSRTGQKHSQSGQRLEFQAPNEHLLPMFPFPTYTECITACPCLGWIHTKNSRTLPQFLATFLCMNGESTHVLWRSWYDCLWTGPDCDYEEEYLCVHPVSKNEAWADRYWGP